MHILSLKAVEKQSHQFIQDLTDERVMEKWAAREEVKLGIGNREAVGRGGG